MAILGLFRGLLSWVLSICGCGSDKKKKQHYVIRANDSEWNLKEGFPNNHIKTSKYNFLTFIPLNLFEQMQRAANLYFVFQIIIMSIPYITALSPSSTAVPLTFVLLATMIKDGFDDYGRHKSDHSLNNQTALVLNDKGVFVEKKWQDIQTGDIIKVRNDESISADVLALCTSEDSGLLFIETAELDGETNLKVRQPLQETFTTIKTEHDLAQFKGEIVCELPNNRLEKFQGNLLWDGQKLAVDNNNIVLRGCVLRNTPWIYGFVVYAGHDSKLMMNSGKGVFKRSKLDIMTNYLVIWIAGLLAVLCTFLSIMSYVWENSTGRKFQVYKPWPDIMKDSPAIIALMNWPGFVMVLNTLIPISLYISVEVIRLGQSFLIDWDLNLYYEENDTPAKARNTTLTEELGQIQYIFSDKTGTLTQNVMMFKECSINGTRFGQSQAEKDGEITMNDLESVTEPPFVDFSSNQYADPNFKFYDQALRDACVEGEESSIEFFRLLALCHTVMVEAKAATDEVDYVPGYNGDNNG
eukprot:TCONS_00019448-protein